MFSAALGVHEGLSTSRRISALLHAGERASTLEFATLVSLGVLTALATSMWKLNVGVPGHAIVLSVFPMALGLALVPRRTAGSIMGTSALVTALTLKITGLGSMGAGALTSLSATGVLMDLALVGARSGWRLYLAFVLAGLGANVAAFGARAVTKLLGVEPGIRHFFEWWPQAIVTHALCGAVAGLVSAAAWFHFSGRDRSSRSGTGASEA